MSTVEETSAKFTKGGMRGEEKFLINIHELKGINENLPILWIILRNFSLPFVSIYLLPSILILIHMHDENFMKIVVKIAFTRKIYKSKHKEREVFTSSLLSRLNKYCFWINVCAHICEGGCDECGIKLISWQHLFLLVSIEFIILYANFKAFS